ncbi:MAG: ABC transporter ATP-binding protein [Thermodesulfobacteriota bacterium]
MATFSLVTLFDQKIVRMVRPYSGRVLLALLFSVISSGASGAIAWLLKPVIDSIFVENKFSMLVWLPVVILLLYAVRGSCEMVYSYLMRSSGIKLVRDLRIRLYEHLLHLPLSSLGKESSGKMISRILTDTTLVQGLVGDTLLTVFKEIPTIIVLLGVAFYRRWDITLLALIGMPLVIGAANKVARIVKMKRTQAQQTVATLTHFISEAAVGAKVVKIFVNEEGQASRFRKTSHSNYSQETKIVRYKELAKFIVDISTGVGVAIVIWYGGNLVVNGVITSGDLFSSLGAVVMIFNPVKQVGRSYAIFHEIMGATDRIWWLERMEKEQSGDIPLPSFTREIRYVNVSHRYGDKGDLVLDAIDLTIGKGEVVAIVGPSGAGKTTFIDLLPRYYDPAVGRIEIDGHDLRAVKLPDLRRLIGLVSQDIVLFNATIRENIAFGAPSATDSEVEQAAGLAFAHDFICEFPDGYETMLGERGLNLSGGQRQRIAIARAILKNPPILILDEATSALDAVSEGLVQAALERLMHDRTTIVVAHRLSTIRKADRILVMERGRIVAQGSHDDLLATSDMYKELYLTYSEKGSEQSTTLSDPA